MSAQETSAVQRPPKGTAVSCIDNRGSSDTPLDYSFWSADDFEEVNDFDDEPRHAEGKKIKKDDQGRYVSKSVNLSNNQFSKFAGFLPFLELKVAQYKNIGWIDLSFNKLTGIDPVVCELPSLSILYLHANEIKDLKQVDHLRQAAMLTKLTLHGNSVDTVKNYKSYVLSLLPNLKSFDRTLVSKADRANAATWQRSNTTKRRRRNSGDKD